MDTKIRFADNHQVIYADKVVRFGLSPSVCRLEISSDPEDHHLINNTIIFNTFYFLDAIENIYQSVHDKDSKESMKANLMKLLAKMKQDEDENEDDLS